MLSFLREQEAGDSSARQSKGSDSHGGPTSDDGAQEFLTVATNRSKLRKSTILVAILVAIGLVCLWFMIRKSQPQAASAKQADEEEARLEVAIGRLTGVSSEMVNKMDRIVKKFYEFSDVFQVRVEDLVKDPFEAEVFAKEIEQEVLASEDAGARATLIRQQRMRERASMLQFLSVMQSANGNACMINDRILREGDTIEGFVVKRIGADFVDLTWQDDSSSGAAGSETEDLTIHLKLSQ